MNVCPVDCHWCVERQCAADGCVLCGDALEAILIPCERCGDLFVIGTRVRVCVECLRADELAPAMGA